jgi:hypothetical protein
MSDCYVNWNTELTPEQVKSILENFVVDEVQEVFITKLIENYFTEYGVGAFGGKTYNLETAWLEILGDYKIEQPTPPKKISKPKHTPPFWANNWRKK